MPSTVPILTSATITRACGARSPTSVTRAYTRPPDLLPLVVQAEPRMVVVHGPRGGPEQPRGPQPGLGERAGVAGQRGACAGEVLDVLVQGAAVGHDERGQLDGRLVEPVDGSLQRGPVVHDGVRHRVVVVDQSGDA